MRTRWVRLMLLGVLPVGAGAVGGMLSGCASQRVTGDPVSHPEALRIEDQGLAAEFLTDIDRFTFFGRVGGSNMLHVVGLDRPRPADGSYVFWGGCYTWVSPQKAPTDPSLATMGWVARDGSKMDWPPDPAMDVGPVRRTGLSRGVFSLAGPPHRSGLQELKAFRILAGDLAEFEYVLENRGTGYVAAGPWINTAAHSSDVIAVRVPPGTQVYGWDDRSISSFMSILSPADERGWRTANLTRASWEGGIKVYLAPPVGQGAENVEIAVWRRSARAWLHRSLGAMNAQQVAALKAAGEGPVAVYIQPGKGDSAIIEAELYGPIADIAPSGRTTAVERWRIIRAGSPDASVLP